MPRSLLPVGIDDMALYVPQLYLDLRTLAAERMIPYDKLAHGLGLLHMAVPDAGEDAATMAAEAAAELIERNGLDPRRIGRFYLGTESALDGAKPTATYALEMLEQRFGARHGAGCFRHCDALDMTFACIGAIDALHNCLDWVASDRDNIAIVVASDVAKYELGSTGEYTQGAGAVAMLVRWHPRLLAVRRLFGTATEPVHDFFKPRRERFTETPVFDGPLSNQCYQDRMAEALDHFRLRAEATGVWKPGQWPALTDRWARLAFHLPYAFHGQRIFVERFLAERQAGGRAVADARRHGLQAPERAAFADEAAYKKARAVFVKQVAESPLYRRFVSEKIEKGQRASRHTGNLYTASVFLALMSILEIDAREGAGLAGKRVGVIAYGSGSKSKVFEATVQPGWAAVAGRFRVFEKLQRRREISFGQYLALHNGERAPAVQPEPGRWRLARVGQEGVTLGARYYGVVG